jgi:hypothetical protein
MRRAMTVTCATAALVVGGAASASAAPPEQQVIPLECGDAGHLDVVTNGNGQFTSARLVDLTGMTDPTGVFVPTAFGDFTLTADGEVVATETGSEKGGGNVGGNNPHPTLTCTFSISDTLEEEEEVAPGVVLPAGTVVAFSGSVTGFITGRP